MNTSAGVRPTGRLQHPTPVELGGRNLTRLGALVVALGAALLGGAVDVLTGPGLRGTFAVAFITGTVLATALVRREGLLFTVVMPPLVYAATALLAGAARATGAGGSWLHTQLLELVTSLIVSAPALLTATAAALLVAVVRGRRYRLRTSHPTMPGSFSGMRRT